MCLAVVKQTGDRFTMGPHQHIHQLEKDLVVKTKISVQVKEATKRNVFQTAGTIVHTVLAQHSSDYFLPMLVNMETCQQAQETVSPRGLQRT